MNIMNWIRHVHAMGVVARWYFEDGGNLKGFVDAMTRGK